MLEWIERKRRQPRATRRRVALMLAGILTIGVIGLWMVLNTFLASPETRKASDSDAGIFTTVREALVDFWGQSELKPPDSAVSATGTSKRLDAPTTTAPATPRRSDQQASSSPRASTSTATSSATTTAATST